MDFWIQRFYFLEKLSRQNLVVYQPCGHRCSVKWKPIVRNTFGEETVDLFERSKPNTHVENRPGRDRRHIFD